MQTLSHKFYPCITRRRLHQPLLYILVFLLWHIISRSHGFVLAAWSIAVRIAVQFSRFGFFAFVLEKCAESEEG